MWKMNVIQGDWGFYTGNNTNSLTSLLENPGVFLLVQFYSISLHSLSAQVSVEDGHVVIPQYSMLRAKSGMPGCYGNISSRPLNNKACWRIKDVLEVANIGGDRAS